MEVNAGALAEALKSLKPVKPTRGRRAPKPVVTLDSQTSAGRASVTEAHYGIFSETIAAKGPLPGPVQLDGTILRNMVSRFPPDTVLSLEADAACLTIRTGRTTLKIPRLDCGGSAPIEHAPLPKQKRYKVSVKPDPVRKRVALADTWGFSARVPMPEHSDPEGPHYLIQK
jgi:hypothetical protein